MSAEPAPERRATDDPRPIPFEPRTPPRLPSPSPRAMRFSEPQGPERRGWYGLPPLDGWHEKDREAHARGLAARRVATDRGFLHPGSGRDGSADERSRDRHLARAVATLEEFGVSVTWPAPRIVALEVPRAEPV